MSASNPGVEKKKPLYQSVKLDNVAANTKKPRPPQDGCAAFRFCSVFVLFFPVTIKSQHRRQVRVRPAAPSFSSLMLDQRSASSFPVFPAKEKKSPEGVITADNR